MLSRSPGGGRRRVAAAALLAALTAAACEAERDEGALVLEPGEVVATYPDPGAADAPTLGRIAALAVTDDHMYVTDQMAGRVHRFSLDSGYLNSLGGEGEGPGEFQQPAEVEVGPAGDVWVIDPASARVTRFRPDGTLVSMHPAPRPVTMDFALFPGERFVVPTPSRDELLAIVGPEDEIAELAPGPDAPPALTSLPPRERFGFRAAFLESDATDGTVYLVLNRESWGVWDLRLDEATGAVTRPGDLAVPAWLEEALDAAIREETESLRDTGLSPVPFNDLRLTPSGLWLTTGALDVLGVSLPPGPDGRSVVVRPSRRAGEVDGRFRDVRHASLRPEGFYAAEPTRVRVFALDTVGVRRGPEIP